MAIENEYYTIKIGNSYVEELNLYVSESVDLIYIGDIKLTHLSELAETYEDDELAMMTKALSENNIPYTCYKTTVETTELENDNSGINTEPDCPFGETETPISEFEDALSEALNLLDILSSNNKGGKTEILSSFVNSVSEEDVVDVISMIKKALT